MDVENQIIGSIQELADKNGASSTKLIKIEDISVENWVRQKCQYGCNEYARHFTCPPYAPTPEITREILKEYENALLVEFEGFRERKEVQRIHEVMFELEKKAFLQGLHKAFAYTAGPCRTCESCLADRVEEPTDFSKNQCKNPDKARPSMEACGINVFKTVRDAGYDISVVREEGDCFKTFGLLLLD